MSAMVDVEILVEREKDFVIDFVIYFKIKVFFKKSLHLEVILNSEQKVRGFKISSKCRLFFLSDHFDFRRKIGKSKKKFFFLENTLIFGIKKVNQKRN